MKNKILILITSIAIVICTIIVIMNNRVKNTDLSNVKIDNLAIGIKEDKINLDKYTESDKYSGNYKYKFEEIVIGVNDKKEIDYLYGKIDEEKINITVNNKSIKKINNIVDILGKNYFKKNYDNNQQLKEYVYQDYNNHIKLEVIYSTNNNDIYWLILTELR